MAGHARLKFVTTECSKTQIRLTRPIYQTHNLCLYNLIVLTEEERINLNVRLYGRFQFMIGVVVEKRNAK